MARSRVVVVLLGLAAQAAGGLAVAHAADGQQKNKPKLDLQWGRYISLPAPPELPGSASRAGAMFFGKPGHWTACSLAATAHNFDIVGEMSTLVIGADGEPVRVGGTTYSLSVVRSAALPKGQSKQFETLVPLPDGVARVSVSIRSQRGSLEYERPFLLTKMPFYQYHLVVAARRPELYGYLSRLDSVRSPSPIVGDDLQARGLYRVTSIDAVRRPAVPAASLYWTSIACLIWDEADPLAFTAEQGQALVDWLHWGGRLVVSGPASLESLQRSFLADYLPTTSAGLRTLGDAELDEISRTWGESAQRDSPRRLAATRPWSAAATRLRPQGQIVPGTGGLVAERRLGLGWIVVCVFPLTGRELVSWGGYDQFFNACILRRPARRFTPNGPTRFAWAGEGAAENDAAAYDPRHVSGVRFFARDSDGKQAVDREALSARVAALPMGELPSQAADVGSWDDFNRPAELAREALQNASRIEIPGRSFVLWVVAGYLVMLVPLNWLVFRLIGRVEWAWAAAPVIALAWTALVIRLAQLDVGFARAATEVAIVELQPRFSRAHVARYTAIYTSLTTHYRLSSRDRGTQIMPFAAHAGQAGEPSRALSPDGAATFRHEAGVSLEGLIVASNSTQFVHSEQMVDVGGALVYEENPDTAPRLLNRSGLSIRDAVIVRRAADGRCLACWLGDVAPGATAPAGRGWLTWPTGEAPAPWQSQRNRRALTAVAPTPGSLHLGYLVRLAEDPAPLRPGDVRLVGWLDQTPGELQIEPASPQSRSAAVVLAHLAYGRPAPPRRDIHSADGPR